MAEWFEWLGNFENSKSIALVLFFVFFCGVLIYVFAGGRNRARRLESHKYIPLQEDDAADRAARGEGEAAAEETRDERR
ncbi:MAG: CcoQ/FixQ family Cbb3-type cytochrome c oxidase assembly chaperone [Candidatus Competibacterales bacterium]